MVALTRSLFVVCLISGGRAGVIPASKLILLVQKQDWILTSLEKAEVSIAPLESRSLQACPGEAPAAPKPEQSVGQAVGEGLNAVVGEPGLGGVLGGLLGGVGGLPGSAVSGLGGGLASGLGKPPSFQSNSTRSLTSHLKSQVTPAPKPQNPQNLPHNP